MFVGSGAVEAGCKAIVGQRLKLSGMRWTVQGADRHHHPALPARQRPLGRDLAAPAATQARPRPHLTSQHTQTIEASQATRQSPTFVSHTPRYRLQPQHVGARRYRALTPRSARRRRRRAPHGPAPRKEHRNATLYRSKMSLGA